MNTLKSVLYRLTLAAEAVFLHISSKNIANLDKLGVNFDKNLSTWQGILKENLMEQVSIFKYSYLELPGVNLI